MIEILNNFHFLRPWFLLFLLLPILLFFKKNTFSSTSSWKNVCDEHLLKFLLINDNDIKKINLRFFAYIALIISSIAVTGPSWKKEDVPTFSISNPNMFILSLSQDMQLRDIPPSRLERAKFLISDMTDEINKSSIQGQFGFIVYSEEPYIISPLTDDALLIKSLLPQIVSDIVPDNGDRLDRAIDLAVDRFKAAGFSSGNIIILASDVGQRFDLAIDKVKEAKNMRYFVNIIDTSYDGNDKLKMLAENGNGVYLRIQDNSFATLTDKIDNINEENMKLTKNTLSNYVDYGYYLVFIPLFCLLMFFKRGLFVILICLFSFDANAGFLLNNNQEAFRLFKEGNYEASLKKFDDSLWKGINLYKLNKNEEALIEFEKIKSAESLYNKGVVLTKLCRYNEAKDAFENSLNLNPQNEDAKYNLDILNDLFEKAKKDPNILNCQNNNNQNKNENDNSQQQNNENQDSSSDNEKGDNQEKSNQDSKEDNLNQNENNSSKENKNSNSEQNKEKNNNSSDNDVDKENQNKNDSESDNKKSNNESQTDNEEKPTNKSSDTNKKDNDGKKNENNDDKNVSNGLAKEGNEEDKHDEEAIAIQRLYREIPEDPGGLLREFIKKEYRKDRYRNENL